MSVSISGIAPNFGADAPAPRQALVTETDQITAETAPAATVEISSGARQAQPTGQGPTDQYKLRPLNVIWGNGPR